MKNIDYLQANEQTIEKEFLRLIFKGIKTLYGTRTKEVIERADYEFEALKSKGYLRYILIAYDMLCYAKENGIEFSARATLNNSIICYLLGISKIDPLYFDLPFKSPSFTKYKTSYPNICIDFEEGAREKVITYLKAKYGENNVAKAVVKVKGGKIGINGCMVVLDNNLSAIAETATIKGEWVAPLTRDEIKKNDIFFIDIMSLKALLFYKRLKTLIKNKYGIEIKFDCKNCTDEETLNLFGTGDTDGIFMFDDCKMKERLKRLEKPTFDNLIDIITLNGQLTKEHCVPFAFLAYELAYCKAHYRLEFQEILREIKND